MEQRNDINSRRSSEEKEKVIIFGLGDIAEIAFYYLSKDNRYDVVAFTVDREFMEKENFHGKEVVPFDEISKRFPPDTFRMFIPLSYSKVNKLRRQKYLEAKEMGYQFISYISPYAFVADNVEIGENCFIFEDNTVQPFVKIGNNCILWSGNHIGHHSTIQDHCFISSHVVISGGCVIGEGTFIGVNATLRDHIKIGKYNVIGAGAIIMHDTKDYEVYVPERTKPAKITSNKLKKI